MRWQTHAHTCASEFWLGGRISRLRLCAFTNIVCTLVINISPDDPRRCTKNSHSPAELVVFAQSATETSIFSAFHRSSRCHIYPHPFPHQITNQMFKVQLQFEMFVYFLKNTNIIKVTNHLKFKVTSRTFIWIFSFVCFFQSRKNSASDWDWNCEYLKEHFGAECTEMQYNKYKTCKTGLSYPVLQIPLKRVARAVLCTVESDNAIFFLGWGEGVRSLFLGL